MNVKQWKAPNKYKAHATTDIIGTIQLNGPYGNHSCELINIRELDEREKDENDH